MAVEKSYKPGVDRSTFPVPDTRPIAEHVQEEIFDLGEDPSVWEIDTEEEEDLTGKWQRSLTALADVSQQVLIVIHLPLLPGKPPRRNVQWKHHQLQITESKHVMEIRC